MSLPGREADLLEPRLQLGDPCRARRAARTRSARPSAASQHDDRHAVVDQRRLDSGHAIDGVAGRQQRAADRAGGIQETRSRSAPPFRARRRCGHRRRRRRARPGVCTVSSAIVPVLTVWTRTRVSGSRAATSPRSIAKGPMPARMLPQFGVMSIRGSSIATCPNRKSMSQSGRRERDTIATLLVSGWAPPSRRPAAGRANP